MRFPVSVLLVGALTVCGALPSRGDRALIPPPMPFYEQTVDVILSGGAAAGKAGVGVLPLLGGRKWAITCRWDDTNAGFNTNVSAVMKAHGIRGTFYLNGTDSWGTDGKERQMVRRLLADGNSIGSHGWTHGMLGIMSANRTFEELLRCRIQLEAASDTPVCSHAFAYLSSGNDFDRAGSRRIVGESLYRSGLYSLGESLPADREWPFQMPHPYYISLDGYAPAQIKERLDRHMASPRVAATNPCLAFAIHPGAHQNPVTEGACFNVAAGRPDSWYCTQDEYGAYRTQYALTRLSLVATGSVLRLTLSRPALEGLNNAVPVTLAVRGVAPSEVLGIVAPDALVVRRDADGEVRFDVGHSRSQGLPAKIDWIANEANAPGIDAARQRSDDFPGLSGSLWMEGECLKWQLRNDTGAELADMRAIYRLPVGYTNTTRVVALDKLPHGSTRSQSEPLGVAHGADPRRSYGNPFLAIEINFSQRGQRGRLYLSALAACDRTLGKSYPGGGFVRIGPIPRGRYVPQMAEDIAAARTDNVVLPDGTVLTAHPFDAPAAAPRGGLARVDLDPEMVFTTGRPSLRNGMQYDGIWIYRTTVFSAKREDAIYRPTVYPNKDYDLNPKTVYANGKKLEDAHLTLNAGSNDVIVVYETWSKSDALSSQNAGFFFQIADAASRKRIETIEYIRPRLP